jgi:peptidoglycan/xylan/chitin deacetylase (PgdA/CDA1 family)
VGDTCRYLYNKWADGKAQPGTVVMVIMFHSIVKGEPANPNQVSQAAFQRLMNDLHTQGFQAITTAQLAGFLEENAAIPPRAVLLLVDDRHYRQYFDQFFRPYWEKWGWPVVNAWISHPDTLQQVWDENEALEQEGWVDHQAHGVIHNVPMSDSVGDDYIYGELQGSIDAFEQHYGKRPIAIIWPGGGFGARPVQIARELGYRLGFTINPRGPLMYNWIPQADTKDPNRPYLIPESPAGDPLLTLPRFWAPDASLYLDTVRHIGNAARAYAEANRETEVLYYNLVCAPQYGALEK